MEKLGINLGFFLFQVLNFSVLACSALRVCIQTHLKDARRSQNKIAQGLEDARVAAEARANAEKEAAKILAEAQSKAASIVKDATERAEKVAVEVKTAAEVDLAKQREAALAEGQLERERILGDLRGQVAALSIAAAQKLIREALDEKKQHALINVLRLRRKARHRARIQGVREKGYPEGEVPDRPGSSHRSTGAPSS